MEHSSWGGRPRALHPGSKNSKGTWGSTFSKPQRSSTSFAERTFVAVKFAVVNSKLSSEGSDAPWIGFETSWCARIK